MKASVVRRTVAVGALVAGCALVPALVGAQSDQPANGSAPSPAPSAIPSAAPGIIQKSAPKTGVPVPTQHVGRTNYIPSIDIVPQSSFATGGDYTPGQPVTDGITRLGGKITETLFGNLSAAYQHGYIDETIGNPGFPINGFVDDPIDNFSLNYGISKPL